jgi:CRP-like cAMP-binding protein
MSSSTASSEDFSTSEFQQNLDYLRQIDFFSGLPIESLKVFAYVGQRETFRSGDHLFHQGEDDGQAFYLISGQADLTHTDDSGEHLIRQHQAGEFVGRLTLLGKMPRLFSMKAVKDTEVLLITREKFDLTVQQFPEVMPRFVKSVVENIAKWEERFLRARTVGCEACMHKVGVSMV